MSKKKKLKFENRNSEFISTKSYEELFNFIEKANINTPFLTLQVEDSGGDGLVEGEAETWIEVKENDKSQKQIWHMMKDDDGESELEVFDMSIQGLHDALDALFSLQDKYQVEEFYNYVLESIA
tara:strand:- start:91 stop:462 length:372 start_codon:yes stop_codon:yes gene_type:complete